MVGSLAMILQAGIIGLAIFIGIMDPPQPREAKLKIPAGSKSKFKEQQQQVNDRLAKLDRLNKAEMGELMEPLMQSMEAQIPVPQPDLSQSFQAMGSMLPTDTMFKNDMTAFTDGIEADDLPPPEPVSFLGESLRAKRIVLLLDVSSSVKTKVERAGLSMEKLRNEVHTFVDQLGHMGTSLLAPFQKERTPGMGLLHSGDPFPNFAAVWLACTIVFWNLSRVAGAEHGSPGLLKVLCFGALIPLACYRLIVGRTGDDAASAEEGV